MSRDNPSDEPTPSSSDSTGSQDIENAQQRTTGPGGGSFTEADVDHRLYGAERLTLLPPGDPTQGLVSLRELRLLVHASKFDRDHRNALYALLDQRIEQFTETEWPILQDMYPEYADRVAEVVCQGNA